MKTLLAVNPAKQQFRPYRQFNPAGFNKCINLARQLKGARIIHINSAAIGGGVAELLKNQVPLEKSLGVNSSWLVLQLPKQFFFITKKIHNLLQGQKGFLSEPEKKYYTNKLAKPGMELQKIISSSPQPTVVILHDPQTLPLIDYLPASVSTVVRLHIDTSSANKSMLQTLKPFLEKADKVIVSHKQYAPPWLNKKKLLVSYPAISPFTLKNHALSKKQILQLFKHFRIDTTRPIMAQISRFDPWKDPEGVIESYYLAKKTIPKLQLVLEGVMEAKDDPQAEGIYNRLKMEHQNDPDIFLHGKKTLSDTAYQTWINALQSQSNVILQKSLREGFGLTVTEALWKGKAVIGGNALGIKAQIKNGRNGFIVKSPAECAKRVIQIIQNPSLAKKLGAEGKNTVRKNFLFNRLILDFLKLYAEVL
ncbi:MAG: glycosyltransferase [Candidatus Doudnabacteria bacterium]|nr:glycosyltransferase [Candidatus Doudnabacteria bacterium]